VTADPTPSPANTKTVSPPETDAAHILIVDDDRRIRQLLQRYLSDKAFRVTTAENAADARKKLEGLTFDIIVLDVMMPGENGLDLTASLRETSAVPILLLTARAETEHRIAGLQQGADDYLPKPFEPRELLLRIESILRRTFTLETDQAEPLSLGACSFDPERGLLTRNGEQVRLTSREVELLRQFSAAPATPISRLDLCGGDNSAERTVDVQINRLRQKIEPNPKNPLYLQTVRGQGYVLMPDKPVA